MANYNLSINSTYNPMSQDFYFKALTPYIEGYKQMENALSLMSEDPDILAQQLAEDQYTGTNSDAYKRIKTVSDNIGNLASKIGSQGWDMNDRDALRGIKKNWQENIPSIKQAIERRAKEAAEQHALRQQKGDNVWFSRDASTASVDSYINDKNSTYTSITGEQLFKDSKDIATALRNWGKSKSTTNETSSEGYIKTIINTMSQKGLTAAEIVATLEDIAQGKILTNQGELNEDDVRAEAAALVRNLYKDVVNSNKLNGDVWKDNYDNDENFRTWANANIRRGIYHALGDTQESFAKRLQSLRSSNATAAAGTIVRGPASNFRAVYVANKDENMSVKNKAKDQDILADSDTPSATGGEELKVSQNFIKKHVTGGVTSLDDLDNKIEAIDEIINDASMSEQEKQARLKKAYDTNFKINLDVTDDDAARAGLAMGSKYYGSDNMNSQLFTLRNIKQIVSSYPEWYNSLTDDEKTTCKNINANTFNSPIFENRNRNNSLKQQLYRLKNSEGNPLFEEGSLNNMNLETFLTKIEDIYSSDSLNQHLREKIDDLINENFARGLDSIQRYSPEYYTIEQSRANHGSSSSSATSGSPMPVTRNTINNINIKTWTAENSPFRQLTYLAENQRIDRTNDYDAKGYSNIDIAADNTTRSQIMDSVISADSNSEIQTKVYTLDKDTNTLTLKNGEPLKAKNVSEVVRLEADPRNGKIFAIVRDKDLQNHYVDITDTTKGFNWSGDVRGYLNLTKSDLEKQENLHKEMQKEIEYYNRAFVKANISTQKQYELTTTFEGHETMTEGIAKNLIDKYNLKNTKPKQLQELFKAYKKYAKNMKDKQSEYYTKGSFINLNASYITRLTGEAGGSMQVKPYQVQTRTTDMQLPQGASNTEESSKEDKA